MAHEVVNPEEPVDYALTVPPSTYVCGGCGKAQVKLWRDYMAFLENQTLRCVDCMATEQNMDLSGMNEVTGRYKTDLGMTDTVRWRVPAIPTPENNSYWGYASVPPEGAYWWERLPLR